MVEPRRAVEGERRGRRRSGRRGARGLARLELLDGNESVLDERRVDRHLESGLDGRARLPEGGRRVGLRHVGDRLRREARIRSLPREVEAAVDSLDVLLGRDVQNRRTARGRERQRRRHGSIGGAAAVRQRGCGAAAAAADAAAAAAAAARQEECSSGRTPRRKAAAAATDRPPHLFELVLERDVERDWLSARGFVVARGLAGPSLDGDGDRLPARWKGDKFVAPADVAPPAVVDVVEVDRAGDAVAEKTVLIRLDHAPARRQEDDQHEPEEPSAAEGDRLVSVAALLRVLNADRGHLECGYSG